MSDMTPEQRWAALDVLQQEYKEFRPFLYDVITGLMGFECSELQLDIALYLECGPLYRMIQAQRGQAKTTITAIYAVWRIIHNPSTRILIISAGGDMATEIANWIIQIISGMDELECLRPDKSEGDRASVKAYDVHHVLKGPEKSPSVACIGITSNMQGKRADVLIADDIESSKNSQTEVQRERIKHLTKDFTSINSNGDIIYLGTPQSIDSVYNSLPSRGFDIRIWPGRYPTEDEIGNYGNYLAPMIREKMEAQPSLRKGGGLLGTRGKPTDPVLMNEEALVKKELDQGAAYFQLQHMLDTKLSDADRFPLKISRILFCNVSRQSAPLEYNFVQAPEYRLHMPSDWSLDQPLYRVASFGQEFGKYTGCYMYVDPAGGGQNGDETAYAITRFIAGFVVVVDIGFVPGGFEQTSLEALTKAAVEFKPDIIGVEENYGKGAFRSIWQPLLIKQHKCRIDDVWESGQKELRIIDTLEPVINNGRLIMDESIPRKDWELCARYPAQDRASFSLMFQLARITREKGALRHDDRVDALAGSVRYWTEHLKQDNKIASERAARQKYEEMMQNPLGNGRPLPGWEATRGMAHRGKVLSAVSKMRRRF